MFLVFLGFFGGGFCGFWCFWGFCPGFQENQPEPNESTPSRMPILVYSPVFVEKKKLTSFGQNYESWEALEQSPSG